MAKKHAHINAATRTHCHPDIEPDEPSKLLDAFPELSIPIEAVMFNEEDPGEFEAVLGATVGTGAAVVTSATACCGGSGVAASISKNLPKSESSTVEVTRVRSHVMYTFPSATRVTEP
jgi:hypothetical protein